MIELPEIVNIARQMNEALVGRRIACAIHGQTPHKFLFTNHTPEEFATRLPGQTIERVEGVNKYALAWLDGGLVLIIGDMGGRVLLHPEAGPVPKKHHFWMEFDDGSSLSVAIQGWGFVDMAPAEDMPKHHCHNGLSPLSKDFTSSAVEKLLETYAETSGTAKSFITHRSPIAGLGNGTCQDVLFRAGLHPRRKLADLTAAQRSRIFPAIRDTLQEAITRGGRDTERDLFGQPGQYVPILDKRARDSRVRPAGRPSK